MPFLLSIVIQFTRREVMGEGYKEGQGRKPIIARSKARELVT